MAVPGLSTLGVLVGYSVVTDTSSLPTSMTLLPRCQSFGAISLSNETIDATCLEDEVKKNVAGAADTGGSVTATFNRTPESISALTAMIDAYKTSLKTNADTLVCIEVYDPKDADHATWSFLQPPPALPTPEYGANALQTMDIEFTVVELYGTAKGVKPAEG